MTKQEKIKEGINEILIIHNSEWGFTDNNRTLDRIFNRLHSQGVVLKTGEDEVEVIDGFGATYKTKCVAVEPLIREE